MRYRLVGLSLAPSTADDTGHDQDTGQVTGLEVLQTGLSLAPSSAVLPGRDQDTGQVSRSRRYRLVEGLSLAPNAAAALVTIRDTGQLTGLEVLQTGRA